MTLPNASNDSRWYQDAIFYELYVRAFHDSDGDGHGDLPGLIEKLDYVKYLGVDCIWLLPINPSPLIDDGYDVADYYDIHPDYGTMADFERLIEEAHKRGIRVITDLVVNHTSDKHPWFIESASALDSSRRNWYVWSETNQRYREARIIFLDTEESNWAYHEPTDQYYWHRFYSSQPDLNYDNPEVQQAMLDVLAFWMEKGIDGFRVDAVPYLYEREGTNCENLPETHVYLKRMRAVVDASWPDSVLLCEANQPPEDVVSYFGDGDEFHMGFHFPVMPRIFMALRSGRVGKIREIMEQTPEIPEGAQWCTFLRNHDELTLEMVSEEERQWMWREYAPEPRMRINLGIRRRLAPLLDNNQDKIMLANRILFSLPGAPIIYYGDEIGMGDNIALEDRDGVRTPMQWDTGTHAGFSNAPPEDLYAPVIDDPVYGYRQVNVNDQSGQPGTLLTQMRDLIAFRKQHRVFALGTLDFLEPGNDAILVLVRTYQGETVVVVHNVSAEEQHFTLELGAYAGSAVEDMDDGSQCAPLEGTPYALWLAPYQTRWLSLREP